jgi:hypothetical protein
LKTVINFIKTMKSAVAVAVLLTALPVTARANERHFAYTYESPTLPAGAVEIEPWTTWRFGRDRYYNRFDHRLEFELGITDRLQTAFYINFTGLTENDGVDLRHSEFEYEGIASEWKWNLRDPVADPFGLALYAELGLAPHETEIETKVIVDKRMGQLLLAGNLVVELELEQEVEGAEVETEKELVIETDLGITRFLRPRLALGVEARTVTLLPEGETHEVTALLAGPTLAYGAQDYWLTLAVQPQIFAIHDGDGARELAHFEKMNVRLLLGFHI